MRSLVIETQSKVTLLDGEEGAGQLLLDMETPPDAHILFPSDLLP